MIAFSKHAWQRFACALLITCLPLQVAAKESIVLGMGCFWGAERGFWQAAGVYTTAVGYAGGHTPNPTYEEVCSGLTGHNEVVRVVFDPRAVSYESLLKGFWEALLETGHITAAILFLITAASIYSRMLGLAGLPNQLQDLLAGSSATFWTIMLLYVLLMIFLGTILDTASIILTRLPDKTTWEHLRKDMEGYALYDVRLAMAALRALDMIYYTEKTDEDWDIELSEEGKKFVQGVEEFSEELAAEA